MTASAHARSASCRSSHYHHVLRSTVLSSSSNGEEQLWVDLFTNPWKWRDVRHRKTCSDQADFLHRVSRDSLWLKSAYKPPWVDACLPTLAEEYSQGLAFCSSIRIFCNRGEISAALEAVRCQIDQRFTNNIDVYIPILNECGKLKALTQVTDVLTILKHKNLELSGSLGDHVVAALAKCGAFDNALLTLMSRSQRSVYSWNAIISGFISWGMGRNALRMHAGMQADGVEPNQHTYVSFFKACTLLPDLKEAEILYAGAQCRGFLFNVFSGSTLISMYGKCGRVLEAEHVFVGLLERNVVCWSALLTAYLEQGQGQKALWLYRQMQEEHISANDTTFVITLQACATLALTAVTEQVSADSMHRTKIALLDIGRAVHATAWKEGLSLNILVCNNILNMYGKCGSVSEAENLFNELMGRDIVSWTAIISSYVEDNQLEKALRLYYQMLYEGESPDQQGLVTALLACSTMDETMLEERLLKQAVCLEVGQALHIDARRMNLIFDDHVISTLVSLYGKCGRVLEAENVFDGLSDRDSVSWSAMMSTYIEQGQGEKVLKLYGRMVKECVTLDNVTIMCALEACRITGSVELCKQLHFVIIYAGFDKDDTLGRGLIRAYGECTCMTNAHAVFDRLPKQDVASWTACIAGYAQEGNLSASLQMFEEMRLWGITPNDVTFLALISVCGRAGRVEKGLEIFKSMRRDFTIDPSSKHYITMVDLLGRTGDLKGLEYMLMQMHMPADWGIWMCILGACRTHGNVELGRCAFDCAVYINPKEAAAYVLMSNMYADAGMLQCANEVENLRIREGAGYHGWAECDLISHQTK